MIEVINHYVSLITEKQTDIIGEIESIKSTNELVAFFENAFMPKSDARLFEIASYVVLQHHYQSMSMWIGETKDSVKVQSLQLYRAGRTNANDGGIDFVLKPLGRIFQVTETLDFRKYFLDFEKLNRYPISFVIKTELSKLDVLSRIKKDAVRYKLDPKTLNVYLSLFEEITTLADLRKIASNFKTVSLKSMKDELLVQFKLEYGLFD